MNPVGATDGRDVWVELVEVAGVLELLELLDAPVPEGDEGGVDVTGVAEPGFDDDGAPVGTMLVTGLEVKPLGCETGAELEGELPLDSGMVGWEMLSVESGMEGWEIPPVESGIEG